MQVIERCRLLRGIHRRAWFHHAHVSFRADARGPRAAARVDGAGRNDGVRSSTPGICGESIQRIAADAPRLIVGSHLDTVPHAGAFDGILGVVLGVALIERLGGRRLPFAIEVVGFSEEEGVRFGVPFIGSRALIGDIDDAILLTRIGAARCIRASD